MKIINNQSGQSLVEVLLALAIFIVSISAVSYLLLDSYVSSRQGVERTKALLLSREGLEAARSIRDNDTDNLTNGAHGILLSANNWIFSGTSDVQDQFTRQVIVENLSIPDIDATDIKKITSTVSWQFSEGRSSSVVLTDYLTDWNQTQGEAGYLYPDINRARLGGASSNEVQGITIVNNGLSSITIDKMTLQWDNANLIEEIQINAVSVWKWDGAGTPDGRQPSGTELDIDNVILPAGAEYDIDRIVFNGLMANTNFVIKMTMAETSTRFSLLGPLALPQSSCFASNTTNADIDPTDNTKVIGITMTNTCGYDIILDKMAVSWSGAPGGTKIETISINGSNVWTGSRTSGSTLDITDFTLAAGGGYPIDYLDFSRNMTGTTISIDFILADGSIKSTGSFSP